MTSPPMLAATARPLAAEYQALLLDLDGVVYVGADTVPGASEALSLAENGGAKIAYLTNNASRPAAVVAAHLRDLGMPVSEDSDVITSAQAIAHLMADELPRGAPVLVVGGAGLRESVSQRGLVPVDSLDAQPVAVVQGYDASVGWLQLAEASYAVQSGLRWYASNTDRTVPTARGIAPGNGALVETVRIATGKEPVVAGKPHRPLFDETLDRLGSLRPLMIGDRLDTDIEGARSAGIDSLAVLTGVNTLADIFDAPAHIRPDFVAADLGGLAQVHPPVIIDGSVAHCGEATANLVGDAIEVTGADYRAVETLRAAVQLAWTIRDTAATLARPGGTLVS